jgi:hypothetical protein
MLKIWTLLAILCLAGSSYGQTTFEERLKNGADNVRLFLGSSQGATNVGIDYERRTDATGLGAFIIHSKKRDGTTNVPGKPEQFGLGITTPIHLIDRSNFDVYIAPAITVLMTNDVVSDPANPEKEDITTFGPALKIGTMYHIPQNSRWSVGFDFLTITNWFSDKVEGSESYANFAVGYAF